MNEGRELLHEFKARFRRLPRYSPSHLDGFHDVRQVFPVLHLVGAHVPDPLLHDDGPPFLPEHDDERTCSIIDHLGVDQPLLQQHPVVVVRVPERNPLEVRLRVAVGAVLPLEVGQTGILFSI